MAVFIQPRVTFPGGKRNVTVLSTPPGVHLRSLKNLRQNFSTLPEILWVFMICGWLDEACYSIFVILSLSANNAPLPMSTLISTPAQVLSVCPLKNELWKSTTYRSCQSSEHPTDFLDYHTVTLVVLTNMCNGDRLMRKKSNNNNNIWV